MYTYIMSELVNFIWKTVSTISKYRRVPSKARSLSQAWGLPYPAFSPRLGQVRWVCNSAVSNF